MGQYGTVLDDKTSLLAVALSARKTDADFILPRPGAVSFPFSRTSWQTLPAIEDCLDKGEERAFNRISLGRWKRR